MVATRAHPPRGDGPPLLPRLQLSRGPCVLLSGNESTAALTQGHQEPAGSFLGPGQLGQSLLKLSPIPSLPELPVSNLSTCQSCAAGSTSPAPQGSRALNHLIQVARSLQVPQVKLTQLQDQQLIEPMLQHGHLMSQSSTLELKQRVPTSQVTKLRLWNLRLLSPRPTRQGMFSQL